MTVVIRTRGVGWSGQTAVILTNRRECGSSSDRTLGRSLSCSSFFGILSFRDSTVANDFLLISRRKIQKTFRDHSEMFVLITNQHNFQDHCFVVGIAYIKVIPLGVRLLV